MNIKGLLAIRRDNGAPLAICEVSLRGWQHSEMVDAETFRARYFTERERDLLAALQACLTAITVTPRSEMDCLAWSRLADKARNAIAACEVQS